jgi:non-ribosomal peptide synthetase component F
MLRTTAIAGPMTTIPRADRSALLPLAPAQQRLWSLDQRARARTAHHLASAIRLDGALDAAALRRSLDTIVARHEVLRTAFTTVCGEPVQVIVPPHGVGFALPISDLTALAPAARDAEVAWLAAAESQAPFDLGVGPLIRARLLRLGPARHLLLITLHHIVGDDRSLDVLTRELAVLYAAYTAGADDDPLPPLTIQYADYAQWQRAALTSAALQRQRAYWQAQLDGSPSLLQLPTDRPRPAVQSYAGADLPVALSAELTAGLRALARRCDATLDTVLLTGWAILLSQLSGQDDVVIGAPVANRQCAATEALIGLFRNPLALRVRLAGDPSVPALVAQVKATMLAAYAHQDLPFEQVIEAVRPPRNPSHAPMFQVMFALDTPPAARRLPGVTLTPLDLPRATAPCDLTLGLRETGHGLAGELTYATALFDRATVERWIAHLEVVLAGLIRPNTRWLLRLPPGETNCLVR